MTGHSKRFTEPIGLKLTKEQFGSLKKMADQSDQPLAEWCRERVLEILNGVPPTPPQYAILAEIVATQDIVAGLFFALGRDGRLTPQKAKEIVDAAHERKYREVAALFRYAESRAEIRRTSR
jgi:hypothetical protein